MATRKTEPSPEAALERGRLPNFVIIGTTKGGTSSLRLYLAAHPEVYITPGKEPHFFDVNYERGVDWYRSHFADAGDARAVGEKTPEYLAAEHAAGRMAAVIPAANLIAILRHPVDRAYSHYWMQQSKFPSHESFEQVIRPQMQDPKRMPGRPHHRYLHVGMYEEHLRRFDAVLPQSPKLILTTDELKADATGAFAAICRFIGVDEGFVPPSVGRVYNDTRVVRSERLRRLMLRTQLGRRAPRLAKMVDGANRKDGYPPLDPRLRSELIEWYRPHNEALAERLGRDLSAWNR